MGRIGLATCLGLMFTLACTWGYGYGFLDLTVDDAYGQINGAWFLELDEGSTGTGNYNAFMQLQDRANDGDNIEPGYNSDQGPTVDNPELGSSAQHNHTIRYLEVPLIRNPKNNTGGTIALGWFAEFRVDINENSGSDNEYLSLDEMEIWLSPYGDLGIPGKYYAQWDGLPNTDKIFDFGGADGVGLNYDLESGSGSGDAAAYIPVHLFEDWISQTGIANPYVYIWTQWGATRGR